MDYLKVFRLAQACNNSTDYRNLIWGISVLFVVSVIKNPVLIRFYAAI